MPKKEDIAFSDYMLKSSIMENKLLSGTNHNIKDYKQLSSNLLGYHNFVFIWIKLFN